MVDFTKHQIWNVELLGLLFLDGTWKKILSISLSFLFGVEKEFVVFCDRSAAGLFLVDIGHAFCSPKYFMVCNPLARTTLRLPLFKLQRSLSSETSF